MRWGKLCHCVGAAVLLLSLNNSGIRVSHQSTFAAEQAAPTAQQVPAAKQIPSAESPSQAPPANPAAAAAPPNKTDAKQPARKSKVTISKATTFITEPLREDGYPDYVAALNALSSKGVTPDNNAVVLLLRAFGPGKLEEKFRAEFFKQLGIEPLPEEGKYYVDFFAFVKNLPVPAGVAADPTSLGDNYYARFELAESRPWTKREFPEIAAWLVKNEKPLIVVVEASQRTHYFSPIVAHEELPLMGATSVMPYPSLRESAQSLLTRAMLRIGEGDLSAAADDLLTMHRLARMSCRNGMMVDQLVAIAIDSMATAGERHWLSSEKISSEALVRYQKSYRELPPLPPASRAFEIGERFFCLDAICAITRNGAGTLQLLDDGTFKRADKLLDVVGTLVIDWDIPLTDLNAWYDRLTKVSQIKDANERAKASDDFDTDVKRVAEGIKRVPSLAEVLIPRKAVSQRISNIMSALFLPALTAAIQADNRMRTEHAAIEISFALRADQLTNGKFPDKLDALVPKYLAKIPHDVFADRPFVYKPTADGRGFMLYSLGKNGKDDAGRGYADTIETENDVANADADDIAVQIPPRAPAATSK